MSPILGGRCGSGEGGIGSGFLPMAQPFLLRYRT
jgi:hypothetical protein